MYKRHAVFALKLLLSNCAFSLFPYWVYGSSSVAVQDPNQSCICHPAGSSWLNINETVFFPSGFRWENCNLSDGFSSCSGTLANDPNCQASYNSTGPLDIANFLISCNKDSCITTIYDAYDSPSYYLLCQNPVGCLPLINSNECTLDKYLQYNGNGRRLYYDFNGWDIKWVYCISGYGGRARLINTRSNMTASFSISFQTHGSGYDCPYKCSDSPSTPCSFDFINDGSCDVKYYVCDNASFLGCKNGEAVGNCTNPRSNEICQISNYDNRDGNLNCPSCEDNIEWNLRSIVYPVDNNDFNQFSVDSCIQPVKDGSCHLPDSFKCKGILWDVCVNGIGQGKCTNDMESCDVIMSSNCSVTKSSTCGAISCDSCDAGWNLPDQPALYDSPLGCMNKPSPFTPDNEGFTIPVSIAGGVVFVGVVSAIITIAACFGYHHYKRQGYQHVGGSVTN